MTKSTRIRAARRLALISSTAALALAAQAAHAGADATDVSEVVITGGLEESLPVQISKYGDRLDVITARQIQAGGFTDVGGVLAMAVPGLSLVPQSGPFSYNTASLQGSRTNELLYLVDGVRISNRLYNTTPPLDTIPAHMVDRIEVLDGGQSLFYGTQAVAGLVNIVTRPFTTTTTGMAEVGGDTNKSFNADGYISGAYGKSRYVLFASRDQSTGFQPFPTADYQPSATDRHRGYRLTTGGVKYAYDFTDDLQVSASYQKTEGFVDNALPVRAASAINRRDDQIATAKVDWTVSDQVQLFLKGYWHQWRSHYDEVDNVPGGGLDHVDDNEFWGFTDKGLNAVAEFKPTTGVETYLGYDVQQYGGRDDVLLIAPQKETTQAVFGQVRLTPDLIPNTHLAAGVRYNSPNDGPSATVWNATGRYDVTGNLFVRGSVGTAFRLPDAESLFANDPINNNEIGNPNLKPEKSRNLNASVGGQGGGWTWELIGFARDTKDLISLSGETPDPNVQTFINLPGTVRARGFEAVGTADLNPSFSFSGSYTHARTKPAGTSLQLAGVPKDVAQATLDWHPQGSNFGGAILANWVGEVGDDVASGFGRQERGHYAVVDLNAWMTFGPGDHHRISLRLENAFDEDYSTKISRATADDGSSLLTHYRGVPRTLHATYGYSF
jgi:vitamin B12 transporter